MNNEELKNDINEFSRDAVEAQERDEAEALQAHNDEMREAAEEQEREQAEALQAHEVEMREVAEEQEREQAEALQAYEDEIREAREEQEREQAEALQDQIDDDYAIEYHDQMRQDAAMDEYEGRIHEKMFEIAGNAAESAFQNSGQLEDSKDEYIEEYLAQFRELAENLVKVENQGEGISLDENFISDDGKSLSVEKIQERFIPKKIADKYILDTYSIKRGVKYCFCVIASNLIAYAPYTTDGAYNKSEGSYYKKPIGTSNEEELISIYREYTRENPDNFKTINGEDEFEKWIRIGGAAYVAYEIVENRLPHLAKSSPFNNNGMCLEGLNKKSILWENRNNYDLTGPLTNFFTFRKYELGDIDKTMEISEGVPFQIGYNKPRRESEKPTLNAEEYATVLAKLFQNAENDFNLAVFGDWGRGKTYLMKMVAKKLEGKNYETVFFNAWKYQTQPQIWAHLFKIVKGESSFLAPIGIWAKITGGIRFGIVKNGYFPFALLFLTLILKTLPKADTIHWLYETLSWGSILLTVSLGISIFRVVPKLMTLPSHNDKLGLQEVIGNDLKNLVLSKCVDLCGSNNLKWYTFRWHFITLALAFSTPFFIFARSVDPLNDVLLRNSTFWSGVILWIFFWVIAIVFMKAITQKRKKRFLLIVDDLDRCPSAEVVTIVDSIRLLLEDQELVRYLQTAILVDEDRLRCAIAERYCEQIPLYNDKSKKIEERALDLTKKIIDIKSHIVDEQIQKLFISTLKLNGLSESDLNAICKNVVSEFTGVEEQEDDDTQTFEVSNSLAADSKIPIAKDSKAVLSGKKRTSQDSGTEAVTNNPKSRTKIARSDTQDREYSILTVSEGRLITAFVKELFKETPDRITPRTIRFYLFIKSRPKYGTH